MVMSMNREMTIGEAAKSSGVSAKMIRHYESIGLIDAVRRTDAGYQVYTLNGVHVLQYRPCIYYRVK